MPRPIGRIAICALLAIGVSAPVAAQAPSASGGPGASPTTSAPSEGTTMMPAGTQFDDRVDVPEQDIQAQLADRVAFDGTEIKLSATSRVSGYNYIVTSKARTRTSGGKWKTLTLDDGKRWKAPPGLPSRRGPNPVGVVAGPRGFVATGNQAFWDSPNNYRVAYVGMVWTSADGRHWSRFDPRSILGSRISYLLSKPGVGPDGTVFVAATVGPQDLLGLSKVVVLSSPDGREWQKTATLDARWSLGAGGIAATEDGLRLTGLEYVCDSGSSFQNSFSVAPRLHIWDGNARGREWHELDTSAGGLLVSAEPPPTRKSDCPDDIQERMVRFGVTGRWFDHIPGMFVAVDGAVERASVSRDGQEWSIAELPGAAVADGGERDPSALMVTLQPDGSLVLLSLETRRVAGKTVYGASQVIAWRSTDDGKSWTMLPETRPIELRGTLQSFEPLADGSVLLRDTTYSDGKPTTRNLLGVAGPLASWGTCAPTAGADCRFATLNDVDVAGQDLTGIDLGSATIAGGDWSGVVLRDARLVRAVIRTALAGADLSGADATSAVLGDLSGATLDGTMLAYVSIPIEVLVTQARNARLRGSYVSVPAERPADIDLSGLDIRGVYFSGASPTGDLRDVDFSGIKMDGASFSHIDLTGARLGKANFKSLTFYGPDTICPDGKRAKEGVYDQTACRMKPPR